MTTEELMRLMNEYYCHACLASAGSDRRDELKDCEDAILAAFAALEQRAEEIQIECNRLDTLASDYKEAAAIAETRAEDAELIAWGLASGTIRKRSDLVEKRQGESNFYVPRAGLAGSDGYVVLPGSFNNPALTPAAREALRMAKEQSK